MRSRRGFELPPALLSALVVLLVLAGGFLAYKKFWGERSYRLHITGAVSLKEGQVAPLGFFQQLHFNVGIAGIRWMVRHDGTVWERVKGDWQQLKRQALLKATVEPDGHYAIDVEIALPQRPPSCRVVLHHSDCYRVVRRGTFTGSGSELKTELTPAILYLRHEKRARKPGASPTPAPDGAVAPPPPPPAEGEDGEEEDPIQ